MSFWQILFIILLVAAVVLAVLYFVGRRMQRKQAEAQSQMEAMKQTVSMLIIDKKKMKIKDSGLPQAVIDQVPKRLCFSKFPIVKAKVGPRVMTMLADQPVFEVLPVKQECKVEISGLYITAIKSVRGGSVPKPAKKKGLMARIRSKASQVN